VKLKLEKKCFIKDTIVEAILVEVEALPNRPLVEGVKRIIFHLLGPYHTDRLENKAYAKGKLLLV
jgi:hypothetical protein